MKFSALITLLFSAITIFAGTFSVTGEKNDLVIKYNNEVLVKAIDISVPAPPTRFEHKVLPDGSQVWNAWNDDPKHKYRREIALRADNCVEISLSCDVPIFEKDRTRGMSIRLPFSVFAGGKYEALSGNGRAFIPVQGEFKTSDANKPYPQRPWRFLAAGKGDKKIIFDFCPFGAGDYCTTYRGGAVRGVWNVEKKYDELVFNSSTFVTTAHDFTGLKVVIREGEFADYDKLHAQRKFRYPDAFAPLNLYSFGASETADCYTALNSRSYTKRNRAGWVGFPELEEHTAHKQGAYYSHLAGKDATFRRSDLAPGFYVVTVGAGNGSGTANNFSVSVNGEVLEKNISIKPGTVHVASKTFHVGKDGVIDIKFEGKFIVSAIGLQFLTADAEDFFFNRGFWVSDGFEPASVYRNIDYKRKPVFALAADTFVLPQPGKEAAGPFKKLKKEVVLPDINAPENNWLNGGHWFKALSNSSTLSEADTPEKADALLKSKTAGKKYDAVMFSGMHSRHTYINHIQRGIDAFKVMCQAADKYGLKVIDHHDATLCWNIDAGFRSLAEMLNEAARDTVTMLPSYQLCISDPAFCKRYYNYLAELVKAGVDGFQIDELHYWYNGCGCQHCRDKFYNATGCYYPVNEIDKNLQNQSSELMRQWFNWRKSAVADWFVELRKQCMPYNKNLVLSMYTTHWGFTRSLVRYNSSHDLFELARAINYFGTEVMSRNPLQSFRSLLPYRRMKNVLTLTYQSPVWAWIYASGHPQIYAGWAASNMANQVALLPEIEFKPSEADFMKFDTSKANMPRKGVQVHSKIALLFSQSSRDWASGIGFEGELFGLAQTLDTMNVSYEFICDNQLNDKDLSKYSALLLTSNTCISTDGVKAIKRFAANGNLVALTTVVGVRDELGRLHKVWPFKDVFGFTPDLGKSIYVQKLGETFQPPQAQALRVLKGKVENVKLYGQTSKGRKVPLMVEKDFGKGKFIYVAGALAAPFWEREGSGFRTKKFEPELEKFVKELYGDILAGSRVWQVNAPEKICTALWKSQDGAIYAHFFNYTGVTVKAGDKLDPRYPQVPYPAISKDITFTLKGVAKTAVAVADSPDFEGSKKLKSSWENGNLTVTLPKELMKTYTIVKVK